MITGIVLAAGDSSRMGKPKAILPVENTIFLEKICTNLKKAGVGEIVVVLGSHAREIEKIWVKDGEKAVINKKPEDGQLSSLKVGVDEVKAKDGLNSIIICLVDLPQVAVKTYIDLIDFWKEHECSIVVPRYNGKGGHPVIIDRKFLNSIRIAPLDEGLHWVMRRHHDSIFKLDVNDPGVVRDVDTMEDYEKYIEDKNREVRIKK